MKVKIMILAMAMAVMCTASYAQGQGGGQRGGQPMTAEQQAEFMKRRIDAMDQAVKLTADEKKKAEEVFTEYNKKTQELRTAGGDQAAMREKMTAAREDQNKKLEALLGAERYKKYTESQPQRGPGGAGGQGGQRPQGGQR